MFSFAVDYATPSALESERDRQQLGLTACRTRPVRFHGRVTDGVLSLRMALQALGAVVWSQDSWATELEHQFAVLDPVITVHPDQIFFEAFSQDQSACGIVVVDRAIFDTEGEVTHGTTNVDFTGWLWAALGEMRTGRETWLRIEPGGFEVRTQGGGWRYETKVDVPDEWVRGFLQLQGAMALPGTRLRCRPVDLLAAIRFLSFNKARVSPRALRFELPPNEDARMVLEPFEHTIRLKGAGHQSESLRRIRTWGRRRLKLLEPLLPSADSVEIFLKGRALPTFYAVQLPGVTFLLGLTGWSSQRWTGSGSFDRLVADTGTDESLVQSALEKLRSRIRYPVAGLADDLGVRPEVASKLLAVLCQRGRAMYDLQRAEYRHRELFESPPDPARLFPPDPRREAAGRILADQQVKVERCEIRETRKQRRLKTPEGKVTVDTVVRDWVICGTVCGQPESSTEIVLDDNGRIIFGRCVCPFFDHNLMNAGPCEHMLALRIASDEQRQQHDT